MALSVPSNLVDLAIKIIQNGDPMTLEQAITDLVNERIAAISNDDGLLVTLVDYGFDTVDSKQSLKDGMDLDLLQNWKTTYMKVDIIVGSANETTEKQAVAMQHFFQKVEEILSNNDGGAADSTFDLADASIDVAVTIDPDSVKLQTGERSPAVGVAMLPVDQTSAPTEKNKCSGSNAIEICAMCILGNDGSCVELSDDLKTQLCGRNGITNPVTCTESFCGVDFPKGGCFQSTKQRQLLDIPREHIIRLILKKVFPSKSSPCDDLLTSSIGSQISGCRTGTIDENGVFVGSDASGPALNESDEPLEPNPEKSSSSWNLDTWKIVAIIIGSILMMLLLCYALYRLHQNRLANGGDGDAETDTTELMLQLRDLMPPGMSLEDLELSLPLRQRYRHLFREMENRV